MLAGESLETKKRMLKRVIKKQLTTAAERMKLVSQLLSDGAQGPAPVLLLMSDCGFNERRSDR